MMPETPTLPPEGALRPRVFTPLAPGRIEPQGWLRRQLRIQAEGITGRLDEFWPDVADSGWIGGEAEGWERGPYWLDGLVPLAFALNDSPLKKKVLKWVNYILEHQHEDGWLGPLKCASGKYQEYDPWPVFVTLKALTQYGEATDDARVVPAVQRFLACLDALLDRHPLFQWGRSRWADLVLTIHWLYERTEEPWLLRLAGKVREQGFDWGAHFNAFTMTGKTKREEMSQISHVVNNAMAVKAPGVWSRQSGRSADSRLSRRIMEVLDRHHGQATGLFSGDEHLAGRHPSQGTELCAVVEYMFSLETLLSILADPAFGDRLERIAYNALPAAFTPDMWAHQYDQQANQVCCDVGPHLWTTNGDDANIFGLQPNYGCCTANLHQGWPKFLSHLWMRTPDNGLAAAAYGPARVTAMLGDGVRVTISSHTEYPFEDSVSLSITPDRDVQFPLVLRIPQWATAPRITVNGKAVSCRSWSPAGGAGDIPLTTLYPATWVAVYRTWSNGDTVEVTFGHRVLRIQRDSGATALTWGPLVFSLPVTERFEEIRSCGPVTDYEVHPDSPWNYALNVLTATGAEREIRVERRPVSERPFDPAYPPVVLRLTGRRISDWQLEPGFHDAAAPPPSPVKAERPSEPLMLIPYGSTHLRITEFPILASESQG